MIKKVSTTTWIIVVIVCCFFFQTSAYSILNSSLVITGDAIARIRNNVRINDFRIHEVSDGVISSYEEFSKFTTNSNVTLPNSDSYIIYKLVIGNYENVEMQLSNITGLSSNLTYELIDYALHDMICDTTNKCISGAEMTMYIKIKYASYDSLNTNYNVNLNYEFNEFSNVLMIGSEFQTTIPSTATHLVFTDEKPAQGTVLTDVSAAKDMGVVGYLDGTTYKISTRRTGVMPVANDDCSKMFYMTNLQNIDLSNLDTSNVTKMFGMFLENSSLTEINLTNFDTSNVTNMQSMFQACSALSELDVSGFDTSSVVLMKRMFLECTSLTELDLSNFDTSSVNTMYSMFAECTGLTKLVISSFDTSQTTDMYSMFRNCYNLTELDVSHFDTSKVTSMERMFYNCRKLSSLYLNNFDTSNVTNMYGMFNQCMGLLNLDLSSFDTGNVTRMDEMFFHCEGLTSLDLKNFNTSNVTLMTSMFQFCTNLTSLNLNNFNTSKVTSMNAMFAQNYALQDIDLSSFDTSNVAEMRSMFCDDGKLKNIYVGTGWNVDNVISSEFLFYGASLLPNYDSTVVDVTKAYVGDGGYLRYKTSNMKINGTTYDFRPGMTWSEWYDSEYNTFLYNDRALEKYTSYFFVSYGDGYLLCNSNSYTDTVSPDDIIVSDKVYYIVSRAK